MESSTTKAHTSSTIEALWAAVLPCLFRYISMKQEINDLRDCRQEVMTRRAIEFNLLGNIERACEICTNLAKHFDCNYLVWFFNIFITEKQFSDYFMNVLSAAIFLKCNAFIVQVQNCCRVQLRIMHGELIAIELKVDGKCALDTHKCVLLFVSALPNIS